MVIVPAASRLELIPEAPSAHHGMFLPARKYASLPLAALRARKNDLPMRMIRYAAMMP